MPITSVSREMDAPLRACDMVVLAASAGRLAAMMQVCAALPPHFPAAIASKRRL
jgi:chemotaxis response regulator CheB